MDKELLLKRLDLENGKSLKRLSHEVEMDYADLINALDLLEKNLKVKRQNDGSYIKTEDASHVTGILNMSSKGYGFIITDNGKKVFVHSSKLGGALNGDRVLAHTYKLADGRVTAEVLEVKATKHEHVGMVYKEKGVYYVKLDNPKFPHPVILTDLGGAYIDNKVVVKLSSKMKNNCYVGTIISVLGHKNDPHMDVLSIMRELGIPSKFSKEVMDEVAMIPTEVNADELEDRLDLRNDKIFTIDGDTAKDFDDAVSIEKLANGNYKLGVHIADVSHYVKEGSFLDKEAFFRGTSVYTPGYVTPMLPHKLSNGICSLNPDVDRLTLSCIMEINENGEVIDSDIVPSVIRSKKRMTYNNVNKVLNGEEVDGYQEYADTLKLMLELSYILRNRKEKLGSISFDTGEMNIETDKNGYPINITRTERGEAERIIEDFMISANEEVTRFAKNVGIPFIYRIHEEPDEEKLDDFIKTAFLLGFDIKLKSGHIKPKDIQKELYKIEDDPNYDILVNFLLRSMKKAKYSNSNLHHFGLALRNYTHFTSPIRRYPDLTVHRALKSLLYGEYDMFKFNQIEKKYYKISEQSSMCEQRSKECERAVGKMKSAEYLSDKIGENYEGQITGIQADNQKAYVKLDNLICGVVDLPYDEYEMDTERIRFTSYNTDYIYTIGSRVPLKLIKSDKKTKTIEFVIDEGIDEELDNEKNKVKVYKKSKKKHNI